MIPQALMSKIQSSVQFNIKYSKKHVKLSNCHVLRNTCWMLNLTYKSNSKDVLIRQTPL